MNYEFLSKILQIYALIWDFQNISEIEILSNQIWGSECA